MERKEVDLTELMERVSEVVARGSWTFVESYFSVVIDRLVERLIVEDDPNKVKRLQGEILAYRKVLRLREEVVTYDLSEDSSEPA